VGRGRGQRGDQAAEQKGLAVLEQHVAFAELDLAGPERLDFPALQRNAGLDPLIKVVLEAGPLVERNGAGWRIGHGGLLGLES
jgi:hypothetical protein